MRRNRILRATWPQSALCCALFVSAISSAEGQQAAETLRLPELSALGALSASLAEDLTAVERGAVTVRPIATANRDEIALIGLVRVAVPRDFYFAYATNVSAFLTQPGRQAFGVLRTPPAPSDFAEMRLDPSDAAGLRKCQVGRCSLKLPAQEMAVIATALDRPRDRSVSTASVADSLMHVWLLGLVTDYIARGDAALPVYDDTRPDERSAVGFRELLAEDSVVFRQAPTIAAYLAASPAQLIPGATSTIYWAIDRRPGLKPILSASQLSTFREAGASAPMFIATKQLYASHYFDSWLDVAALVAVSSAQPCTYVALVRRVRFDHLPSRALFDLRDRVVRKLRDALREELTRTRQTVEAAYVAR